MANSVKSGVKLGVVALVAVAGLLGAATQLERFEVTSLWVDFLGGFHPVVLHLPIGVMVWIAIQTVWRRWRKTPDPNDDRLVWAVAALTATASFGTGYLLAMGGGYRGQELDRHLWSAAAFSAVCWVGLAAACGRVGHRVRDGLCAVGLMSVTFTGHYGGLMVHGDPFAAAPWLNDPSRFATFEPFGPEVRVFEEIVQPILGAKCIACHGPTKQNGRLRLDSFAAIRQGGGKGSTLVPGDATNSKIVSVIRLPMANDDHMPPPNRPQISAAELAGLEFWVEAGASSDQVISRDDPPAALVALLTPGYRLLEDPAAEAARLARAAAAAQRIAVNRKRLLNGLQQLPAHLQSAFSFADQASDRLRFSPATHRHRLTGEDLAMIVPYLQESVEVDLASLPVTDELLGRLASAPHLRSLDLSESKVGDTALVILATAPQLERLNLYATQISAEVPIAPGGFQSLQKLFVGGTLASVEALQAALPHAEVVGDLTLAAPASARNEVNQAY